MWNLPPPPNFLGLREDVPLTVYHRRLPHWRQEGATYFLTMRLEDSLPGSKLRELVCLRQEWERKNPKPHSKDANEELARIIVAKIEKWLDQGYGSCRLRDPTLAGHVIGAMNHFNGKRYELDSYVVMPNHLHAIVRPLGSNNHSLEDILGSWKQYSCKQINRVLAQKGSFWQDECFDRIIRDEEHLYRAIQYIGRNPSKAGLAPGDCPLWIRPEWVRLGWTFESVP